MGALRRQGLGLVVLIAFALAAGGATAGAAASGRGLGFDAPVTMPGSENSTEPAVAISMQTSPISLAGVRYTTWQSPGQFASSPDGATFTRLTTPDDSALGDTSDAVDAAGALYNAQICGDAFALHACVYRSVDGGQTWPLKTEPADSHPGAADRPWIDVYPKTSSHSWNPDQTTVYLEYHTFSPEDLAYVTVSTDGGHTFSLPRLITTGTNAIVGSGCNTVPSGVVADPRRPNVVYALWLSGNDVVHSGATGCNYSQLGPFDKAWVSTSTDGGVTWTANLAWQGHFDPTTDVGDNADKLFGAMSVDRAGQVHVLLPVRRNDDPVTFGATGHEDARQTQLLLVTSPDRGAHWTPPVNLRADFRGSNFFPWIAAGSSGRIDAVYYQSSTLKPNDPASVWFIAFSQITRAAATLGPNGARFIDTPRVRSLLLDQAPVHTGGICTFGIFCSVLGGNRNLADSISVALDPGGGANAIWTNDQGLAPSSRIDFACQSSGPSAFAGKPALAGCFHAGQ